MRNRLFVLAVVAALIAGLAPTAWAMPKTAKMDVTGVYDDPGTTVAALNARNQKARVRTAGLAGEATITCTNQRCIDLGLDGGTIQSLRDIEIVLDFKGSDEELQAVIRGRSRATNIFTDGFESGDVTRVRGTASCEPGTEGGLVCDVEVNLRGRLKGPDLTGRTNLTLSGELTLAPDGGSGWGIIDWLGSLEVAG